MSMSRWSSTSWEVVLGHIFRRDHASFFPHKIFRWNAHGVYVDCFFPFPCQHLLGGEALIGKSIQEVLPNEGGRRLLEAFRRTRKTQVPQDAQLLFSLQKESRVAVVRLMPFQSGVMGFVTDHFMDGRPLIAVLPKNPSLAFLKPAECF